MLQISIDKFDDIWHRSTGIQMTVNFLIFKLNLSMYLAHISLLLLPHWLIFSTLSYLFFPPKTSLPSLMNSELSYLISSLLFFLHLSFLLLSQITEETFQTMLDRVATTKDFSTVRDNVLYFLQVIYLLIRSSAIYEGRVSWEK